MVQGGRDLRDARYQKVELGPQGRILLAPENSSFAGGASGFDRATRIQFVLSDRVQGSGVRRRWRMVVRCFESGNLVARRCGYINRDAIRAHVDLG